MISAVTFTLGVYALLFGTVLAISRVEYEMPLSLSLVMALAPVLLGGAMGTVGTLVGIGFAAPSGAVGAVMFVGALAVAAV